MRRLADATPPNLRPQKGPPKWREAPLYVPDPDLALAMDLAIDVRQPLLLTGEPGCGKTSAAWWAAWHLGLGLESVVHDTIRSDATAARLRWELDAVRYLREALAPARKTKTTAPDRRDFIQPGPLWRAFKGAWERPVVLLLDEIDKAPRDVPNDLLHELDERRFEVDDLPPAHTDRLIRAPEAHEETDGRGLWLVVFTSNGERRLPDAFLRRCVHHHLRYDDKHLERIIKHRRREGQLNISDELVALALERFAAIRRRPGQNHRPSAAEGLLWVEVLSWRANDSLRQLRDATTEAQLPHLGLLVKDSTDLEQLRRES
jgi:MoxR-like ATPase